MGTTLLAISAVLLFFFVIFYIAKTSELSSQVKGDADDYTYASKLNGALLLVFLIVGMIGVFYTGWKLIPRMVPESASEHGIKLDSMFNITSGVAFFVFFVTHVVLLSFAFIYRYKKDRKAFFFPHSNTLEAIWTIIPAIVLAFLVARGISVWREVFNFDHIVEKVDGRDTVVNDEALVVEVTAKQFGWTIRYPGLDGVMGKRIIDEEHVTPVNELGVDFEGDANSHDDIYANKLVLVKNKPTLVKLGALDVLHGFYLPHFRVKLDCVPGLPTKFQFTPMYTTEEYIERLKGKRYWETKNEEGKAKWETFKFELACTELCGRSHFGMQKDVVVVTQEEYDKWVAEQKPYYTTVINPEAANEAVVDEVVVEEETISDELKDTGDLNQLQQLEPGELEKFREDTTEVE